MTLSTDSEDLKKLIRNLEVEKRIIENRLAMLNKLLEDAEKNKKMEEL